MADKRRGVKRLAAHLYARRVWIDEMFRGFKHRLGLRESQVVDSARLERLMLGLVPAYPVLALVGLFGLRKEFAAEVIAWGQSQLHLPGVGILSGAWPTARSAAVEGGEMKQGTRQ
jgi:hypothetical protein